MASKRIRIGGALLIGAGIILGAFSLRSSTEGSESGAVVAVPRQVERTYIRGEGDWAGEVETMALRAAKDAPEIDIEGAVDTPTDGTMTDSFARSFFENYTRGSLSGALTDSNQDLFLKASIADLFEGASDSLYTARDVLIGESSDAYLRTYGNTIAEITVRHSPQNTENELAIFERFLQTKKDADHIKLTNIANTYSRILADTLKVAAPPELADEHLMLLNAYQAVQRDIDAMAMSMIDPVHALLRVQRYDSDVQVLSEVFSRIYIHLYEQGVRYGGDEPASMFRVEIR